jgi:hypothetical protein
MNQRARQSVTSWLIRLVVSIRNMHVVNYNRIPHIQSYGADGDVSGWVRRVAFSMVTEALGRVLITHLIFLPLLYVQSNVLHFHDRQTYAHLTDLAEVYALLTIVQALLSLIARSISQPRAVKCTCPRARNTWPCVNAMCPPSPRTFETSSNTQAQSSRCLAWE